jgi:hypothetical protein
MNAATILGTFGRTAVRLSPLTYNPAVIFTLNQNNGSVLCSRHAVSRAQQALATLGTLQPQDRLRW